MQDTPMDNPTPLISFIITCYDLPADMLNACIASIRALILLPHEREIIVIDDGSAIPALTDIASLKDEIIYLRQPNRGLSSARNMGLQVATGQYIQFVDGDDSLVQAPYEHCLDIVRYHQPDVVTFHLSDHPDADTPYSFEGPMDGATYIHNQNIRGTACGYIFSRQLLGSLRFTPGILHEDEEFTPLLLLRAERLYCTDAKAYYYRKRGNSIVHNTTPNHIDKRLADTLGIIGRLQQLAQTLPGQERVALGRRIAQLSMDYLYNTISLTHSRQRLNDATEALSQLGLYPLPDRHYTRKYQLFRRMVQSGIGRTILLHTIR